MEITISRQNLKRLLHAATNNAKDFAIDNEGFIDEWLSSNNQTGKTFYALLSPEDKLIDVFWNQEEAMKKLDHYQNNVKLNYYVKVFDKQPNT